MRSSEYFQLHEQQKEIPTSINESAHILIQGCTLLAPYEPGHVLHNQDILITGKHIQAIGPGGTLDYNPFRLDRVVEGAGRLAIPGLINAHTHSLENMLKATSPSLPLELWLVPLFSDTVQWSPRFAYLSVMLGAIDMLKTGTTAVLDHLWTTSGVSKDYLDATMQAYKDVGIRAAVAPSIEDRDLLLEAGTMRGLQFPSHPFIDRFALWPPIERQIATLEQFITTWHQTEDGRLRCLVGPSGIHWCSPILMQICCSMAEQYNTGLHLHAVETELQARVIREILGQGGIAYLHQIGALKPGTSLAHAIWLDPGDLELLAKTGTTVVHNPVSNLRLGSGVFPLADALNQSVTVALGSDGSASNDTQNMFGSLKLAGLIHNRADEDYRKWPRSMEILEAATLGGAAALGMPTALGEIAPGRLADIVLLDLDTDAFFPLRDAYLHLVYCENGSSVDTVFVNGQIVVEHGKVVMVDEQAIRREIREHCQQQNWPGFAESLDNGVTTREVLTKLDMLRKLILQRENEG